MKLTAPAGYGRFGDERGRLTLVRPASAIPGSWRFTRAGAGELAAVRVVEATVPRELGVRLARPLLWLRIAFGTEWFAEPGGRTGDLV
ncbi:MAG TPA: hypothetical protein VFW50_00735 [Streptosporangiaceae bacterium]|nr:hypothetical protein [Streptosporangiaceae bacterium]